LIYYSSQFNAIELNATFYRLFPKEQFVKWREKTPEGFRFFPKITQEISHWKRLSETERLVDAYIHSVSGLEDKLGMIFLQMHNNFSPKDFDRVVRFIDYWPKEYPLTVEFRHTDWYNDVKVANEVNQLLLENKITSTIVETAGRRDLIHMRLTSPSAFVRWTGANHKSDYKRLDDWVERIADWISQGIEHVYFFVHQNLELESPLLAAYFINKLNIKMDYELQIPKTLVDKTQNLFN